MKTRQFNNEFIKRCEDIRSERQHERDVKGFNKNPHASYYSHGHKIINMTGLSTLQFITASEAIKDGYALQYGEITPRMAITTIPEVACVTKETLNESAYLIKGGNLSDFLPIEGKTTHIDLYVNSIDDTIHGEWVLSEIYLVGGYGFVVTNIKPPIENITWSDILRDPKHGPDALVKARESALDFSHYNDGTIFE